jgi:hypothetical protein
MRRSWQSYLLNGLFRVMSKRRFPTEPDIADMRSTYERPPSNPTFRFELFFIFSPSFS